jgi:hypothetical protein
MSFNPYSVGGGGRVGVAGAAYSGRSIAMPAYYGAPVYRGVTIDQTNRFNIVNQYNNVRVGAYYRPPCAPFYGNVLTNGWGYNYWGYRPGVGAGIALAGLAIGSAAVTVAALEQQRQLAALYPLAYYGTPPQYLAGDGLATFGQVMQTPNPLSRNAVGELVNHPLFPNLGPQAQSSLLQLVGTNPSAMPAVRNALNACASDTTGTSLPALQALLADPRMASMSVYRQSQILQAFAQNPAFATQMLAAPDPFISAPVVFPQPVAFMPATPVTPDIARRVADLVTRGVVWTDHGKIRGSHQITDPRDVYQRLQRGAAVVINGVAIRSFDQLPGVLG